MFRRSSISSRQRSYVRRAVTTLVSGIEVGNLFDDQKVFDEVVWGAPEIRQNLSDVEDLLIDTPPPLAAACFFCAPGYPHESAL